MKGKIVIELVRDGAPDTGSALPDMAHVAYTLKKHVESYEETAANGVVWHLVDAWKVASLTATTHK